MVLYYMLKGKLADHTRAKGGWSIVLPPEQSGVL